MISQDVSIKPGVIKVVLKSDAKALDEVVVTAMGISREKKALGYAVQDVKSDQLTQAANSNLAGALQGKVSGLDVKPSSGMPGASSQITIRGARSFSGDNTPLYVIDGMPVTSTPDVSTDIQNNGSVSGADFANRAVDIDPNDIESINILKGQAASALYGIRASNGVIIITTKSGKGLEKGKPQVSFSSNVSFDVVGRLPEFQHTHKVRVEYSALLRERLGDLRFPNFPPTQRMEVTRITNTRRSSVSNRENIMFPSVQQPVLTRGLLHRRMTMQNTSSTQESPGAIH